MRRRSSVVTSPSFARSRVFIVCPRTLKRPFLSLHKDAPTLNGDLLHRVRCPFTDTPNGLRCPFTFGRYALRTSLARHAPFPSRSDQSQRLSFRRSPSTLAAASRFKERYTICASPPPSRAATHDSVPTRPAVPFVVRKASTPRRCRTGAKGVCKAKRQRFQHARPIWRLPRCAGCSCEFAEHEMTAELNDDIYFAHPYHFLKRGLNENNNGLLG